MDKEEALSMALGDLVSEKSMGERHKIARRLMFLIPLILGVKGKWIDHYAIKVSDYNL